jgi:hypothetical protein
VGLASLEDDDGTVQSGERYDYDPYGELETEPTDTEAAANPLRFDGFYYDSGVKTYDMLARPYRPTPGASSRRPGTPRRARTSSSRPIR